MENMLIENNIDNCPDYCIARKKPSNADERLHLVEVNGVCPVCGNSLLKTSGKKTKLCEIAHIYPHSPTTEELKILKGVQVFGENSESFQNKIALCFNCHKGYDFRKTKEEYNKLLNVKRNLYTSLLIKSNLSEVTLLSCLYDDIEKILDEISKWDPVSDENIELKMKPIEVKNKFLASETLLKNKVRNYVIDYFHFIKNYTKNLTDSHSFNFDTLATNIKLAYKAASKSSKPRDEIFDFLTSWLVNKTQNKNKIACEIIISFFVQNCEVFDEVTE
ncbi:HNH endonuclease [Treponema sp. OMZ 788]|uniref:ABC-three component system protein n=1 Tax=Treponema sp. OMZ 788 TaxID=2563664 RepID=UPI0020A27826|nr:ABC-three component system protein [Treponema sp. OMZ 788]UTC64015.1 HNH endonuclease [Treponema sp. OMZ 788]